MNYIIDPEKLKAALINLSTEERGRYITSAVANMLSETFSEDWAYQHKAEEEKASRGGYTQEFELFWKAYHPDRRTGKGAAFKSWKKLFKNKTQEQALLQACLKALAWQLKSKSWKDGFVPLPATYLNQRRWEDEPPEKVTEAHMDMNGRIVD